MGWTYTIPNPNANLDQSNPNLIIRCRPRENKDGTWLFLTFFARTKPFSSLSIKWEIRKIQPRYLQPKCISEWQSTCRGNLYQHFLASLWDRYQIFAYNNSAKENRETQQYKNDVIDIVLSAIKPTVTQKREWYWRVKSHIAKWCLIKHEKILFSFHYIIWIYL